MQTYNSHNQICFFFFGSPGVDSMAHYEQALRQIRYRNWRPASLGERKFRVTCSELNGRYTSNEFNLEVSALQIEISSRNG